MARNYFSAWRPSFLFPVALLSSCASTRQKPDMAAEWKARTARPAYSSQAILPDFIGDPLEPMNRGIWDFNQGLLLAVVQPTSKVYRKVVRKPVRDSIKHFTRNATYPGRVLNHALQGRWQGAGDETTRFLCNTTAGGAGFFDVATKWNIPKSDADFSQTFGTWGWQPNTFLVLPLLGPSDDRHATGYVADSAAEPWNYASSPYNYAARGSTFNAISERTEPAARLLQTDRDSYAFVKYAWTYATKDTKPDWTLKGPVDVSTLQTLGAVSVTTKDPDFSETGHELSVKIPSTGRRLKCNYWLQPHAAPLVYISPGLSSHRLSSSTLSVAEHLYLNGFSVVATTSVFHPEFMENASSSQLPAYSPADSRDLLVSLTEMDRALDGKFPGRFGKRALVGCSMGAFLTLRLSACEKQAGAGLLRFDRYVAVNMPVDLRYGAERIDGYYEAPLAWPAADRQARLANVFHKGAALAFKPDIAKSAPPFDASESKYVIGLSFRLTLRDILFSTQSRNDMGIIQSPLSRWKREEAYRELMSFTFRDYFRHFAVPYYAKQGISLKQISREANLRTHQAALRSQTKARIITNENDFLLGPGDLSWLKSTFGPARTTLFPQGGHLGNLGTAPVQGAILNALSGLK